MELYVGTKMLEAVPMTRLDYNKHRGWTMPEDENGADEGYLSVEVDTGHTTWHPKALFAASYQVSGALSYSSALLLLDRGFRVARAGWNGKNMFVFKVQSSTFKANRPPLLGIFPEGTEIVYRAHLDMKYADGTIGVWLASHSDMLEHDWGLAD